MKEGVSARRGALLGVLFRIGWVLTPLPAIAVYFWAAVFPKRPDLHLWQDPFSAASVATALGLASYAWLAGQFFLAAKPAFLQRWLGQAAIARFHGTMAIIAWATVFFHRIAMVKTIPNDDTLQARIGTLAWLAYAVLIAGTLALMANWRAMRVPLLKDLRGRINRALGLDYPRLLRLHRINLVVTLAVLVHVSLASRSTPSTNPLGFAWNLAWPAFCIGIWLQANWQRSRRSLPKAS